MKTSHRQYETIIEFMEENGDLSKPSSAPRGRRFIQKKWKELVKKLNSDNSGDSKTEERWRKVWCDYKNNCTKKIARIKKNPVGVGGAPQLPLNDHENRIMQIIGTQEANTMPVEEGGIQVNNENRLMQITGTQEANTLPVEEGGVQVNEKRFVQVMGTLDANTTPVEEGGVQDIVFVSTPLFHKTEAPSEILEKDWNTPGTSTDPPGASSPPSQHTPPAVKIESEKFVVNQPLSTEKSHFNEEGLKPGPQKKKKSLSEIFLELDKRTREYARERDKEYYDLETERLKLKKEDSRVKEFEIRERVRQRDEELQLQNKLLEFMKEATNVLNKCIEKSDGGGLVDVGVKKE